MSQSEHGASPPGDAVDLAKQGLVEAAVRLKQAGGEVQLHLSSFIEAMDGSRQALQKEIAELKAEMAREAARHHDELDRLIDAHRDQLDLQAAVQTAGGTLMTARESELTAERDAARQLVKEVTAERDRLMHEASAKIATLTDQLLEAQAASEQASSDALAGFTGELEELREQVRKLMLELARERELSERLKSELDLASKAGPQPSNESTVTRSAAEQVSKREAATAPPPRRGSRKPQSSRSVPAAARSGPAASQTPVPAGSPGHYRMTAVEIRDELAASRASSRDATPTEPPRSTGKKRKH
ncbi:MAG: hypothetical protein HY898_32900 [Deltaproteobacteria bacterium]|nr:hypothetical protein [Deltaproteobacteria bacterium]